MSMRSEIYQKRFILQGGEVSTGRVWYQHCFPVFKNELNCLFFVLIEICNVKVVKCKKGLVMDRPSEAKSILKIGIHNIS